MIDRKETGPIQGPVVGQYLGIFDGMPKEQYQRMIAAAPFDKCNLLLLAFVRTFELIRCRHDGGPIYVAQLANGRDTGTYSSSADDTDGDRLKLIVEMARKRNPAVNILISLGWGDAYNDAGKAALSPVAFADSVRTLVQAYDLNGFDIDFESTTVEPEGMLALAQEIRQSLSKINSKRPMIMTITPAQTTGLNKEALEAFDYVLPQTYDHGGLGITAEPYAELLGGSYSRIVFGLNSESDREDPSDDPARFAEEVKAHSAAGMFAWRLDNDSPDESGFPTFATAIRMWDLMHPGAAAERGARSPS